MVRGTRGSDVRRTQRIAPRTALRAKIQATMRKAFRETCMRTGPPLASKARPAHVVSSTSSARAHPHAFSQRPSNPKERCPERALPLALGPGHLGEGLPAGIVTGHQIAAFAREAREAPLERRELALERDGVVVDEADAE